MRVPNPFSLNLLPKLDTRVEWMAYCLVCECEQIFAGRLGVFCGSRRLLLGMWTRESRALDAADFEMTVTLRQMVAAKFT